MPGALSDLVKALSSSRDDVLPSARVFPAINFEKKARELRVVERAEDDAHVNFPPAESTGETTTETDVRAEIDRIAAVAKEEYRRQLDLYEGRIRRSQLGADVRTDIEAAGERAISDLRLAADDDFLRLELLRREAEGRTLEFDRFRTANRLDRLPVPVERPVLHKVVIAALVLAEGVFNGLFFAKGSETGIIGGVSQALGLALLNIALAVGYSRFVRPHRHHVSSMHRALAVVGTTAYIGALFGLNLAIGHFRELFGQSEGSAGLAEVAARLTSEPFGLADVQSLLLVLLGILFNLIAVAEASKLWDPYPGYGAVAKRKDRAFAELADARTECIENLTGRRDQAIAEMSQTIKAIKGRENEIELALNGRSHLHDGYVSHASHLADCYTRLVQLYREANLKLRTTTAPARFSVLVFPPSSVERPERLANLPVDSSDLRRAVERMEHFLKEIRKEFDLQASRFNGSGS